MESNDRAVTLLCGLALCTSAAARTQDPSSVPPTSSYSVAQSLKSLSLEQLMGIEVTSVSKTVESLGGAAAAIAVVSGEDIRRSGATTVPEALRFVPGIHVARRNSNSWAVSARGFSSVNSEKLLVLSDTRSVYTPLYSGVFWDVQDYLLEDIERIEVIRGPGAALWGSNAVNGVINITTRNARDTQGTYLEAAAGTEERAFAGARHGGRIGESGYFRVFGRYVARDDTFNPIATSEDDWRMGHAGFRADWEAGDSDTLTLQGDVYRGTIGQLAPAITVIGRPGPQGDLRVRVNGGNVLGRWRRALDDGSDVQLRVYYDRTHRDDPSYRDDLDTIDLDFQHRFAPIASHELLWGLNYRYTDNSNVGKGLLALDPAASRDDVVSGFVQDQISLLDTLRLTVGTKLEHNDFSGFEIQPSVRLAWEPVPAHVLWGAVSRAVRVPTRLERDISVDATDPAANPGIRLVGNDDFDAEELMAYELGYRWQVTDALYADVALFHSRYEGLASLEIGEPFVDPTDGRTIVPVLNRNLTDGSSEGLEALLSYAPMPDWRLTATYSYVELNLDPRGADLNRGAFLEGTTPRHNIGLRSSLDLPGNFQLDAQLRHESRIRSMPELVEVTGLPAYTELDVRFAWLGPQGIELSVVGQNLLHGRHSEFGTPEARGAIERGVYGKLAWRF